MSLAKETLTILRSLLLKKEITPALLSQQGSVENEDAGGKRSQKNGGERRAT